MNNKKTAVLIHGYHLQANGWKEVVWGDPQDNLFGTIPRGVEIAFKENVDLIYWGSGASEIDGVKESEYTYNLAVSNINILASICNTTPQTLESFLKERSYIDQIAKDTKEEINSLLDICLEKNIQEIFFVPIASQAPIATRRILSAILENQKYSKFRRMFKIFPSDTRYPEVSMNDIIIFAPPHRGDRLKNPSHLLARKTLDVIQKQSKSLDKEALQKFLSDWDILLNKYL